MLVTSTSDDLSLSVADEHLTSTPTVHLDEKVLRVDWETESRMYGRWDCLFGYWERCQGEENWQEATPNTSFLTPSGHWNERALFYPHKGSPPLDLAPLATPALTTYLSLIPSPFRRLASPFGNRQWQVLEMLWWRPEMAHILDNLIEREI